jgi:preprotein translocase subunit SecA
MESATQGIPDSIPLAGLSQEELMEAQHQIARNRLTVRNGRLYPTDRPVNRFGPSQRGVTVPQTRVAPKVGRNDPCYCGSGIKFKRCHGSSARQ